MKKILLLLFFIICLTLLTKKDVYSQYANYYTCNWNSVSLNCDDVDNCYPGQVGDPNYCNEARPACLAKEASRPCECSPISPPTTCNPAPEATATPSPTPGATGTLPTTTAPGSAKGAGGCNNDEIYTAIGCIPVNSMQSFTAKILGWAIGIAGGVAFIMIVISGYIITTAAGDPKRLQGGKELLTAAFSGLLLLIFSVFLLRLIGVEILNLPGLSN